MDEEDILIGYLIRSINLKINHYPKSEIVVFIASLGKTQYMLQLGNPKINLSNTMFILYIPFLLFH